ncbi:MAG: hypothetical protein RLY31_138 [Bacteroidota bacterium]
MKAPAPVKIEKNTMLTTYLSESVRLLCLLLLLLLGCANPIPPDGGPRDTVPPQVDTAASTPNFQTRFVLQPIVLAFDEWVELKDAFTQIVISPPLEYRPEIVRRKKTIQVTFDEKERLRDSATYVINFGEAIRDLTEGNVAPVVFVFSTGDYIDSLTVAGTIADAYTGKPAENVLFMLYEDQADSVVRRDRPFYFARTDKEGRFLVSNVKEGRFKAFALKDQNLNYRFDNESELVAFPDSLLRVQAPVPGRFETAVLDSLFPVAAPDTTGGVVRLQHATPGAAPLSLRLFQEPQPLYLREKGTSRYGLLKLGFNRDPWDAGIWYDSLGQRTQLEYEKDTVRLWYDLPVDTQAWRVYVRRDTLVDTVTVPQGGRAAFLADSRCVPLPALPADNRLTAVQACPVWFNHPLSAADSGLVSVAEDSSGMSIPFRLTLDSAHAGRRLLVSGKWREQTTYRLTLLPGAVRDLYGLALQDTLVRTFSIRASEDFGVLSLQVAGLDSAKAYVLRLLGKGDALVETFLCSGETRFARTLSFLTPGIYNLEIIEDLDRNGRWTTGSYWMHRQPERVLRSQLEELRANWEMESVIQAGF